MKSKRFSLSTLITASLLIGFVGFGLGFNYPNIKDKLYSHTSDTKSLPPNLDFTSVESVYDELRKNYAGDLNAAKLIEGAKSGLVKAAGDPYTEYFDEEAAKEFNESLDGTFSGIGAEIAIKNDRLVIVSPLAGSPAEAAGLKAGDYIVKINDESTAEMAVGEAVTKIRGPAGSNVRVTIVRANDAPKEVTITRSNIEVPSVTYAMKPGNIGYIELSRFSEDSAGKIREAATSLKAQGATKIVLDLRNNPGGLLESAVDISDEFLDKGKIVEEKKDDKVVDTVSAQKGGLLVGLPTVVLINEGSASASEIIAGALQDNKAATIVGEKSFGKGSVQELIKLGKKTVLKVTIALWYTPNGKNISKEGINPDVKVDLSQDDFNNNRDPQLDKAIEILQAR